ncbi:MAG: TraR/DksA family transcriptional regulator [Planctomycetota bacterium]
MTRKSKIKEMQSILVQRRDALRKAIAGDDSMLRNFSQQNSGDVVDFACDSNNLEVGSKLAEAGSRELKRIELALQGIQDGTYGVCKACQKNIPLARLQALPYAALCIRCKVAAEEQGLDPSNIVDWSQILDNDASSPDIGVNFT